MKRHSALSNEIWLLRRLVKYEKRFPLLLSALIAMKLLLPLLSTLLPAAAVAALTRGGGMGRYLAVIGGLMALYAGAAFLRDWLENRNVILRDNFRQEVCVAGLMKKAMTMDYSLLESAEGQRELAAAKNMAGNPMAGGVNELVYIMEPWLRNLLGILLYGAAAAVLDWRILLVLAGMTAANCAAASLVRRYEVQTQKERAQGYRERDYLVRQSDNPANGKDVRLYRMESWFMDSLHTAFQRLWVYRRKRERRRRLGLVSDTLFLALRDILAYTVLVSAFLSGEMDAAGFTFSLGVLSTLTMWLSEFIQTHDNLLYYSIGFNHFRNFMDREDPVHESGDAKADAVRRPPRVELRDVTFTYPEAKTPAIDHLSLTLEPGEKVALVGLNGAGKTTLVKLLSGLYRPDSGEILIDGVPAEQFDPKEYWELVGTVFQDVSLLPFTIGENVAGVDLSGGQRQRLAFARALLKDAPLLILDEPTAALDPLAEADLYRKYAQETADKTSVFISHRLGSTQFCRRVVYMEGGRITEVGSHQELLARGGAYAKLFEVQSSWYKDKKEGQTHEEN